ncbi:MAG: radical SAM protein [Bryobacteraceae bacterium]
MRRPQSSQSESSFVNICADSNKPAITCEPPKPLRRLSVCLINPRYTPTFWGFDFALPLMPGKKSYSNITGALPALAALTPPHCDVKLLDENVEPIDYEALLHFDVIGLTGMIVQAARMREILLDLGKLPAVVVVGGAYVSVAEDWFAGLCDIRFIGEAEETWPAFLTALAAGEQIAKRYEQAEKTDMRKVPAPRFDLLKPDRYQLAPLQFSRGCPFQCEFCDIITVFGRRPRVKTVEQMIKEFEAVHQAGFQSCFLADDNFIGNKKQAKILLRALIEWQQARGYPLQFYTEASVNLADDPELIDLMAGANFRQVFIGVESPRGESLAETRKFQNIRGDSLEAKIQRIRDGGIVVIAGFIVGFDHDDGAIFDEQFDFIQRTGIAQAAVGLLTPIPTTPLYDRLKAEGRLDFGDPDVLFHPRLMSRETLKRGYEKLLRRLYEPEAYFDRLFRGYRGSPAFRRRRAIMDAAVLPQQTVASKLVRTAGGLTQAFRLALTLARARLLRRLGGAYLEVWFRENLPLGRDALPFCMFVHLCVIHWHFYNVIRLPKKNGFGAVSAKEAAASAQASLPAVCASSSLPN